MLDLSFSFGFHNLKTLANLELLVSKLEYRVGFGLFPLRSPLLGESRFLSFPPGTKMFQFPGLPSLNYCIHLRITGYYSSRVAPFGDPRIEACLRLTVAFRSLPRPSSALGA